MIASLLPFPDIDPVLIEIPLGVTTLAIRWYALAYIAGFLLAMAWINRALRRPALWAQDTPPMQPKDTEDLLTYVILGTILGGRLGWYLFYFLPVAPEGTLAADPFGLLRVWEGGMSFHGGFLGVICAGGLFCWRKGISAWSVGDCFAISIPFGLFFGRIANFINAELWGRPTEVPWAFEFPTAPPCPLFWEAATCGRHPSQLYEALLEGALLFVLFTWLIYRRGALKRPGQMVGLFLVLYGASRILVEFFRQGDDQFTSLENPYGLIVQWSLTGGLTMGALLSIPMVLAGLVILIHVRRRA